MDGASLKLKGTKVTEFANLWAKRLQYKIQIEDPENPGEMIDNPETRDSFLTRKMFEQACDDVTNQIKEDMKDAVDSAVADVINGVEIDTE